MEEMDLRLVHPKMESSFFGNPNQRNSVGSGEYPETFFSMFAEMAKRVWLLHCLAFSFDPEAAIFQGSVATNAINVRKRGRPRKAFDVHLASAQGDDGQETNDTVRERPKKGLYRKPTE
ncbi:hypothetical protein RJ640_023684 [Escallonia rubra]|uniref:Uncharacterized protein n=1 Tax=Escallonia rubra TaxID=112253 RepID=A0AA88RBG0_9ASTE|nr:hypothetical protein RJ640_023684 [Escallonia rubra]